MLLPQEEFIACLTEGLAGLVVTGMQVDNVYDEEIIIPGTTTKAASKPVTVTYSGDGETVTETYHEVQFANRWRWVMNDPSSCP